MAKIAELDPSRTLSEKQFDDLFEKGIEISLAFLHQALAGPGIPAEKTLSHAKIPNVQMSWTPIGLLLKAKGKRLGIPQANVANWFL